MSAAARPVPAIAFVFAALSVLLLACNLFVVYRGTYPCTKGPGDSLVYFGSIADKSREDHLDDVLEQVHRDSEIVDRKFVDLRRSYRCLPVAVASWRCTYSG